MLLLMLLVGIICFYAAIMVYLYVADAGGVRKRRRRCLSDELSFSG